MVLLRTGLRGVCVWGGVVKPSCWAGGHKANTCKTRAQSGNGKTFEELEKEMLNGQKLQVRGGWGAGTRGGRWGWLAVMGARGGRWAGSGGMLWPTMSNWPWLCPSPAGHRAC